MENLGTFKIAEPCHENWNQMSPETQGRFCSACQRCVVDFTQKTPLEMKTIYEQEGGKVCGRVRVSQVSVSRPAVRANRPTLRQGALKGLQMFGLALLLAFTGLFHSEAMAQKEIMGKMAYVPERTAETEIYGQVTNMNGEPASKATVTLTDENGTVAETHTDTKGMYRFKHLQSREYSLSAYGDNGHAWATAYPPAGRPIDVNLALEEVRMMGEMIYIPEEPIEPIELLKPIEPEEKLVPLEILRPLAIDSTPANDLPNTDAKTLSPDESILLSGFELKVFPNPTSDRVTMIVDKVGTENLEVSLYDIDGKVVFQGVWLQSMETRKTVDMQTLPSGIYILNLRAGEQSISRQLLKI